MFYELRKIIYILISILLLYFIVHYFRIIDVCVWAFHMVVPLLLAFVLRFLFDPCIVYFKKVDRRIVCVLLFTIILLLALGVLYYCIPKISKSVMMIYQQYEENKSLETIHPLLKNAYDIANTFNLIPIIQQYISTTINFVMYWMSNILLAFGISFYLVFDDIHLSKYIEKWNFKYQDKVLQWLKEIKEVTFNFLKASMIDFVIFFVVSYLLFTWLSVEYAIYVALILGLTNLIAYIGPFLGGIPVIIYSFTISSTTGYLAIVIVIILQVIESTFIQPLVFKQWIDISPIALFIALTIFGSWFGIIGMIIAPLLLAYLQITKNIIWVEKTE